MLNTVPAPEHIPLYASQATVIESRDIAKYGGQLRDLGDEPSVAILTQVIEDEKEHYRELSRLIRGRYPQRPTSEKALRPEKAS